jgi:hypothetical protein
MSLNTTDIDLEFDSGWLAIPCTGTVVHIVRVAKANIECRVGISSISGGFVLKEGDTLKSAETIYVRPQLYNVGRSAKITVVKD